MLARYLRERAPLVADPARMIWAVKALAPYWNKRAVSEVKGSTCRAYAASRGVSPATTRRELNVLQAALNHAHAEGILLYPPKVTLTDHGQPRSRWLTREEAGRLLRGARASRNRTLARFILIALYTGTRPGAVLRLRFSRSEDSGWVDLDRGILHRKGDGEAATKKRRGACRLPRPLLGHLRRWRRRSGDGLVVSWGGRAIGDIGKALDQACIAGGVERITPHVLKHTAVTWAFQKGMTLEDAADYFSTSAATLERVYRQHSPLYQDRAVAVLEGRFIA